MNSDDIETKLFQRFMNAYSSVSNQTHYDGSLAKIKDADCVLVLGTRVASDSKEVYEILKSMSEAKKCNIVYAHPIEDYKMKTISEQFMKYEPGSEEGVLALLAYHLLKDVPLSKSQRDFLDDLDLAYLEAESNTGEEEFEEIVRLVEKSKNKLLIVGNDLMAHDRAKNIAKICALIEENSSFSFLLVSAMQEELTALSKSEAKAELEEVQMLPEYNGTVIYNLNPSQDDTNLLRGSAQFAQAAKISDGDYVSVFFAGVTIDREFKVDSQLKGTIAINPTFDAPIDVERYRFERSKISKINQRVRVDNE